jgi:hypothetical protein
MCKYFINEKERCIVKSDTGDVLRPTCINDLIAYHAYLLSRGQDKAAQNMLRDVAKGEKVISKMIAKMQGK